MRGKEKLSMMNWARVRITPAYAGKRFPSMQWWTAYRDHPRVCGEKGEKGGHSHEQ